MLLSNLLNTPVESKKNVRGFICGIGFFKKSGKVKYLFCSKKPNAKKTDFTLNAIPFLQPPFPEKRALRSLFPKPCFQLSLNAPLYTLDGVQAGILADATIENGILTSILSNDGVRFSFQEIYACADAVILRKKQVYPLGQPVFGFSAKKTVTKPLLKKAIKKGKLIRLTLSLPPFQNRTKLG